MAAVMCRYRYMHKLRFGHSCSAAHVAHVVCLCVWSVCVHVLVRACMRNVCFGGGGGVHGAGWVLGYFSATLGPLGASPKLWEKISQEISVLSSR